MMPRWSRSLQERQARKARNSNMERSHLDTMRKQNTMQVFFSIRAFLYKLDGYRAVAFKTGGEVYLRSRNGNDFNGRYPAIVKALAALPDETTIDGEIVALESGRPSFNALQNYGSSTGPLYYYVFDVMIVAGTDIMAQLLSVRRAVLRKPHSLQVGRADPRISRIRSELEGPDPVREGARTGGFDCQASR